MASGTLGEKLVEKGYRSVEDVLYALETGERSDLWVYVACDRGDDDELKLVNATGFYPDELTAGLAGETYVRNWKEQMTDDDPPPETFPIPLFIEQPRG